MTILVMRQFLRYLARSLMLWIWMMRLMVIVGRQHVYRGRFQSRMSPLLRSELSITSLIGRTRAGVNIVFALDDQTPSTDTVHLRQPADYPSLWRTIASCVMQEVKM